MSKLVWKQYRLLPSNSSTSIRQVVRVWNLPGISGGCLLFSAEGYKRRKVFFMRSSIKLFLSWPCDGAIE